MGGLYAGFVFMRHRFGGHVRTRGDHAEEAKAAFALISCRALCTQVEAAPSSSEDVQRCLCRGGSQFN